MIEQRMLLALRQGQLSKWFSGIGQEAIAVGATLALKERDWILPLHRNLGVFTTRKVPLEKLFRQWLGRSGGFTRGRDRSFHFGSPEHSIIGMISHLGAQLGVADGLALAAKLDQDDRVALAFCGDGQTSEGDFHEALNLAAVWDLPVLFLVENNGYALSTPSRQQFRCEALKDKGIGYGVEAVQVDGNRVEEVYQTVQTWRQNPRPFLVEALTFRMRGHEQASGTSYVPKELLEHWSARDPIARLEDGDLKTLREEYETTIDTAWRSALAADQPEPDGFQVLAPSSPARKSAQGGVERRFIDAIAEGLAQALEDHPGCVLMGQDVAEYGGVFKASLGLKERFPERVLNTPLCESAVVGAAMGLAIAGRPAIVEMQFADFASCAFNQLLNNLAKTYFRWGQSLPVVIRMPTGAGVGAGPFHSQSLEATFFHIPGLKIVYPAFPDQAKGLLLAAVEDPNPVLYFEHKALYRRLKGQVPEGSYTDPIGPAQILRRGGDVTIVCYGLAVHWVLEELDRRPDLEATIVNLTSLAPLDWDSLERETRRTGRLLIVHEDNLTGGIGAELAARLGETCFEYLDAPISRCASLDSPIPFQRELEKEYLAESRLAARLDQLLQY